MTNAAWNEDGQLGRVILSGLLLEVEDQSGSSKILWSSFLHDYILYLPTMYLENELDYVMYGHLGDGNIHTRPIIDMNSPHEVELIESLADRVFGKVIKKRINRITCRPSLRQSNKKPRDDYWRVRGWFKHSWLYMQDIRKSHLHNI